MTKVQVKITKGVAYEYATRDVFAFAQTVGTEWVSVDEANDMLSDAAHYADPSSTDMEASARRIYAAHRDRLHAVLNESAAPQA